MTPTPLVLPPGRGGAETDAGAAPAGLAAPRSTPQDADAVYFESPLTPRGTFHNPWGGMVLPKPADLIRWKLATNPHREEKRRPPSLPVVSEAVQAFDAVDAPLKVLWPGHATALVQTHDANGRRVRVLIDPIFGRAGGVVPRVTRSPIDATTAPAPDVIAVTHGHHDHLDTPAIRALTRRCPEALVAVPRGLDRALPRGVPRVAVFDWWHRLEIAPGVDLVLVPAQHWHRRGAFDQNKALWGGWVVRSPAGSVYHSGDTGDFGGFGAIGRVVGPVDVAILPLGAYAPEWFMHPQHMPPGASLRAFDALGASHLLGMHWGTFDLSDEPIDAGPKALAQEIAREGRSPDRLHVLHHGGTLALEGGVVRRTHAHGL